MERARKEESVAEEEEKVPRKPISVKIREEWKNFRSLDFKDRKVQLMTLFNIMYAWIALRIAVMPGWHLLYFKRTDIPMVLMIHLSLASSIPLVVCLNVLKAAARRNHLSSDTYGRLGIGVALCGFTHMACHFLWPLPFPFNKLDKVLFVLDAVAAFGGTALAFKGRGLFGVLKLPFYSFFPGGIYPLAAVYRLFSWEAFAGAAYMLWKPPTELFQVAFPFTTITPPAAALYGALQKRYAASLFYVGMAACVQEEAHMRNRLDASTFRYINRSLSLMCLFKWWALQSAGGHGMSMVRLPLVMFYGVTWLVFNRKWARSRDKKRQEKVSRESQARQKQAKEERARQRAEFEASQAASRESQLPPTSGTS